MVIVDQNVIHSSKTTPFFLLLAWRLCRYGLAEYPTTLLMSEMASESMVQMVQPTLVTIETSAPNPTEPNGYAVCFVSRISCGRIDPLGSMQFHFLRIPMWTLPFAQMGGKMMRAWT